MRRQSSPVVTIALLCFAISSAWADIVGRTCTLGDKDNFTYNGVGSVDHSYVDPDMISMWSGLALSQATPFDAGNSANRVGFTFLFDAPESMDSAFLDIAHKRFEPGFVNAHVAWFEPHYDDSGRSAVAAVKGFQAIS